MGLQDPFLVILDEDEEDETSLLDKAVEANMEFLKVSLDRTVYRAVVQHIWDAISLHVP